MQTKKIIEAIKVIFELLINVTLLTVIIIILYAAISLLTYLHY